MGLCQAQRLICVLASIDLNARLPDDFRRFYNLAPYKGGEYIRRGCPGFAPLAANRAPMSGSWRARRISLLSFMTFARGVPAGATPPGAKPTIKWIGLFG